MLERMGISPVDLLDVAPARPPAPTFAEYVPVVSAAVSPGARRVYGSYWRWTVQAWGAPAGRAPGNSENWFLRECYRYLADDGIAGVVS
jgi:hypothetical protein